MNCLAESTVLLINGDDHDSLGLHRSIHDAPALIGRQSNVAVSIVFVGKGNSRAEIRILQKLLDQAYNTLNIFGRRIIIGKMIDDGLRNWFHALDIFNRRR